jgi:hypothetical protein
MSGSPDAHNSDNPGRGELGRPWLALAHTDTLYLLHLDSQPLTVTGCLHLLWYPPHLRPDNSQVRTVTAPQPAEQVNKMGCLNLGNATPSAE